MKILLLEHPRARKPWRCNDIANTPLSSCLFSGYVAATLLREGHQVEISEGYLENLSYRDIKERVRTFAPDILGAHMVYHWGEDRELSRFLTELKQEFSFTGRPRFIAAYGYYPSFAWRDVLAAFPAVDAVLTGEPELTFKSLVQALSVEKEVQGIPGLVTARDKDEFSISLSPAGGRSLPFPAPLTAQDPDTLPFPLRTPAMRRLPEVNLLGSRGCRGRCTFCHLGSFSGRWRGRSPENIAEEIDSIIRETGARDFYFTDPSFFGPGASGQERALRLAGLIKPLNIRFGLEARADDIREHTIGALAEAGLRQALLGLESGRDEALRRLRKGATVRQGEEALRILRRHGIEPNVGFIMFEPASTLEDIQANFDFLKRNGLLENLAVTANVLSHRQILLKGTEGYRLLFPAEGEGQKHGPDPYEVETGFDSPGVAGMALVMGRAANLLFARMDGIWSGRVLAPPGSRERYRLINGFFVGLFEATLSGLQSGRRLPPEEAELLAARAEEELLEFFPGPAGEGTKLKSL